MNESIARIDHRIRAGALLLALCIPAHLALAKVSVPYGEDGTRDSDTEAKAQAYNNALDGPKDGQSEEDWEIELKTTHDALYGPAQDYSSSTPSSSDADAGGPPPDPPIDLCESTLDDWLSTSPATPMTDALGDSQVVAEVETALENFVYYMVLIQTATGGATRVVVDRPTVSDLRCTDHGSTLKATFPVTLKELGVTLDHGTVVLHGSPSERTDVKDDKVTEWCFDVDSYGLIGFSQLSLELIGSRLDDELRGIRFCNVPYTDPPWGTKTTSP